MERFVKYSETWGVFGLHSFFLACCPSGRSIPYIIVEDFVLYICGVFHVMMLIFWSSGQLRIPFRPLSKEEEEEDTDLPSWVPVEATLNIQPFGKPRFFVFKS